MPAQLHCIALMLRRGSSGPSQPRPPTTTHTAAAAGRLTREVQLRELVAPQHERL